MTNLENKLIAPFTLGRDRDARRLTMARIGLFYGSSTGKTRRVAFLIRSMLDRDIDIHDIADAKPADLCLYDQLILGTPTEFEGDLQTDWEEFLYRHNPVALAGRQVALFGLGNQRDYPHEFCDGMKRLYDWSLAMGARVVAPTTPRHFRFVKSKALVDGRLVGLGLDEDTQPFMTEERVVEWIAGLKHELN
jgi:flavodoxin I